MTTQTPTAPGTLPVYKSSPRECTICLQTGLPLETVEVRCNVRRFRNRAFAVWRCRTCLSLHCERVEHLAAYYVDYPIRNQQLDYFSSAWYGVVLERLVQAGLSKNQTILDFGCNKGLFLQYLRRRGYTQCRGYDLYVQEYQSTEALESTYDLVISLDVLEHDDKPRDFVARLARMVKPGGRLCIETPNAAGIRLDQKEEYIHALHVPYHVNILSQNALRDVAMAAGLRQLAFFDRWYMDSWQPGTARLLFETLLAYAGNDIDAGYEAPRIDLFFKHPSLLVYLFFGYFFRERKNDHMMFIFTAP